MTDFIPSSLMWRSLATGTLNDANLEDEIATSLRGSLCWIGISLENIANGDDFDIELNRWDGAAWRQYKKYNITKVAGVIFIDEGGGAVEQNLDEINFENVFLNLTRKLQLKLTRNSATDRDFDYFYNKQE